MADVGVVLVVLLLAWVGVAVIVDVFIGVGLRRDRRPDLGERLRPYPPTLADEAETWLRQQL